MCRLLEDVGLDSALVHEVVAHRDQRIHSTRIHCSSLSMIRKYLAVENLFACLLSRAMPDMGDRRMQRLDRHVLGLDVVRRPT